jgi:hypothetical protein
LDLLLAQIDTTFERWLVLNAAASESFPAEVGLLVPALAAALDATDETVRLMVDEAEADHHIRVVSAPSGDPAAARAELTAQGKAVYQRLCAVIDELMAELSPGLALRFGR